jgi:hypothetical protein
MLRLAGPVLTLTALLAAAGCASDERQWMKLREKYTTQDFQRDHAACSKGGKLDEACMRSRGWVAVNPSGKVETRDPLARELGPPSQRPPGRY